MRTGNSNRSWKKKTAVFLMLAMVASVSLPESHASAATKSNVSVKAITLSMEEDTQVLVIGETYDLDYVLTPSNAKETVTFRSSNPSVASVSKKTGEITAKKRGVVTIVATTARGKKVTKTFYVVNPQGTTAYQTTLDKMLASSNMSKLVLKNSKTEQDYLIKRGNYLKKVLYVNAPYSNVKNYATFKKVYLVDVAEDSWREYGNGNSFTVTDQEMLFVVASSSMVKTINFAGQSSEVTLQNRGSIENVLVSGKKAGVEVETSKGSTLKTLHVTGEDAKVAVHADGTIGKIVIDSKAEVVIEGTTKSIVVEVTKKGEGAVIHASIPVEVTAAADVTFALENGAEASTFEKASESIDLVVKNDTTKTIVITTKGTDLKEEVLASTSNEFKTATITGVMSEDGKSATYTLPVNIGDLDSVIVKVGGRINKTYRVDHTLISLATQLLKAENVYIKLWENGNSFEMEKGGYKIAAKGSGLTKKVTFDGITYVVTVNPTSKSVTVKREGSSIWYTLSKSGNRKLYIKSNTNSYVGEMVSFEVTY